MIETKILGDAPGIQNQGLIDKTESTSLPAMTNGVIVGRFKRGRMDKAMVVTANNYQAVLGHDPSNPSYLALEDVFALGVNQVSVLRTGSSVNDNGNSGSGGNGSSGGGIGSKKALSFLKLYSEILTVTEDSNAGIVYKLNDNPIQASIIQPKQGSVSTSMVAGAAVANLLEVRGSFFNYDPDLFGLGDLYFPEPLNQNFSYIFGMDFTLFVELLEAEGQTVPDGFTLPESEVVVTFYPASKLPSANIDDDLFNLIIDPVNYTQSDKQYFSERGITPAVKNPDGSYTIKSQLTLSWFEQTSEV